MLTKMIQRRGDLGRFSCAAGLVEMAVSAAPPAWLRQFVAKGRIANHVTVALRIISQRTDGRMNVSDERTLGVSADTKVADARGGDHQVTSARHAAEALFKPKAQYSRIEGRPLTADVPASTEEPLQRKPRILTASPATHVLRAALQVPATPPSTQQRGVSRQRLAKIPPRDYKRIRTLATYGMTREQIAELYETRLSEVVRIVGNDGARDDD